MSVRASGQIRQSQAITTWGPGALIDLPTQAGIVGGLECWPSVDKLQGIPEPRLERIVSELTGVRNARLYAPPAHTGMPGQTPSGIVVWRFPEWMLVQEETPSAKRRSRRLVHRRALDEKGRCEGRPVVATRFVAACARGHVQDMRWRWFVHGAEDRCTRQLWLHERGTGGDLADLEVRCECGRSRRMSDAAEPGQLGRCWGARPWLGSEKSQEQCGEPLRLLIRTASNSYFPLVVTALSLPEQGGALAEKVTKLWEDLQIVEAPADLRMIKRKPQVAAALTGHGEQEILETIERLRHGDAQERPVKLAELEVLLAAPEGYGEDVPIDPDFHARRLPEGAWRRPPLTDRLAAVVQIHRLRAVSALIGFTRFEAFTPDIYGDYETGSDVCPAMLAREPEWFPAFENRGEGLLLALEPEAIAGWLKRPAVQERLEQLAAGHKRWAQQRKARREFPGGPYILLHTLSHLLMAQVAMHCGYPASDIRERICADYEQQRYALLLYTASSDAEGTLGGLVSQGRHIAAHLEAALRSGGLCSNDPVCAQHSPDEGMEGRWLHGAACHGCALIAETSCEMRNNLLDRALLVPTVAVDGAAFFDAPL